MLKNNVILELLDVIQKDTKELGKIFLMNINENNSCNALKYYKLSESIQNNINELKKLIKK